MKYSVSSYSFSQYLKDGKLTTFSCIQKAKELGFDAGFGAGKYADDVASFAVTEMVKRGMK